MNDDVLGLIERLRKPLGAQIVATGFWLGDERADEVCIERREAADALAEQASTIEDISRHTELQERYRSRLTTELERLRASFLAFVNAMETVCAESSEISVAGVIIRGDAFRMARTALAAPDSGSVAPHTKAKVTKVKKQTRFAKAWEAARRARLREAKK